MAAGSSWLGRNGPPTTLCRFLPALSFAAGAAMLIALFIGALSLDQADARLADPRTRDAYVGGDVIGISARVQGTIVALPVDDNQLVHAGEIVAIIDDAAYRAHRDQARAACAAAQARLAEIAAQERQLVDQIGQSRSVEAGNAAEISRSTPELTRQRALVQTAQGVQAALDRAVADQQQMQAGVAAAHAGLRERQLQADVLEAQRQAAEAAIRARQADLAQAELQLGWTRIVAPVDGTLGARRLRAGDLATPGAVVVDVTKLQDVWVDANLLEKQAAFVRPGHQAALRIATYPGERLAGTVAGISGATGGRLTAIAPDNTTGNFTKVAARLQVRIVIQWRGSHLRGLLRPGMSATVEIRTGAAGQSGPAG